MQLKPRQVLFAAVAASSALIVALLAVFVVGGNGRCSSRTDVEARVGLTSAALQQAAAQGKIKIEDLATGIKRMNEAATAYNTGIDHAAYCEALATLSEDYKLNE